MAAKFSEGVQKVLELRSSARKDQALGELDEFVPGLVVSWFSQLERNVFSVIIQYSKL